MKSLVYAAMAFGLGANAQNIAQNCPSEGTCYSLHIPESTASEGSGNIYFQMTAPLSQSWVALGQGSEMAGSHIFVAYADGEGNVTVSPRLGVGNVLPEYDPNAELQVLEGSGINDTHLTANVMCSNCDSWDGGSMDFSSNSGTWIYAWLDGEPLDSTDAEEPFRQHSMMGGLQFDFASAQGGGEGAEANPFLASTAAVSSTSDGGSEQSSSSGSGPNNMASNILLAHGVIASLAFLVFFPAGAILIRVAKFRNSIWVHAGMQAFSYILFIVAFGMGVWMASNWGYLNNHHPIIGIVLFCVLFFQPIGGWLHHVMFKKHHKRTIVSHFHIWIGRLAIILGMINGGLGLRLAQEDDKGYLAAYGVVAGVIGVAYIAAIVYGEMTRRKQSGVGQLGEHGENGSRDGPETGEK